MAPQHRQPASPARPLHTRGPARSPSWAAATANHKAAFPTRRRLAIWRTRPRDPARALPNAPRDARHLFLHCTDAEDHRPLLENPSRDRYKSHRNRRLLRIPKQPPPPFLPPHSSLLPAPLRCGAVGSPLREHVTKPVRDVDTPAHLDLAAPWSGATTVSSPRHRPLRRWRPSIAATPNCVATSVDQRRSTVRKSNPAVPDFLLATLEPRTPPRAHSRASLPVSCVPEPHRRRHDCADSHDAPSTTSYTTTPSRRPPSRLQPVASTPRHGHAKPSRSALRRVTGTAILLRAPQAVSASTTLPTPSCSTSVLCHQRQPRQTHRRQGQAFHSVQSCRPARWVSKPQT